tara:strand:+ start:112 stop:1989 length:1878 start_codon:yes stop_codon:yes gene_type:complete
MIEVFIVGSIFIFLFTLWLTVSVSALKVGGQEESNLNGTIDEVLIYDRALSPSEVKQHYSSNLQKYDTNEWVFQSNQSNLDEGRYTFFATVIDVLSSAFSTVTSNVIIDRSPPEIILETPLNGSGDSDGNVTFEYFVTDDANISNCSLFINGQLNQTDYSITRGTTQSFNEANLSISDYNWTIECTDPFNFVSSPQNRTFRVIQSFDFDGNSTDLTQVNISNITNFVLEDALYGKINYTEDIDLANVSDINLRANISFNRIEINASAIPNLNKSARITFYNLTFTNPMPLHDDASCDVCTEISYINSTFIFDVPAFSVYSSQETPTKDEEAAEGGAGGGGGGGAGAETTSEITSQEAILLPPEPLLIDIIPSTFNIDTTIGEREQIEITVTNTGTDRITLLIDQVALEDIVRFTETTLTLAPSESKTITVDLLVPEEAGVYTGKISFSADARSKFALIALNVESERGLFDISVDIPDQYKQIIQGDKVTSQITMIQAGLQQKVDVTLQYLIKDFNGDEFLRESETLAVFKQKSFRKTFQTSGLPTGDYVIGVELVYPEGIATASSQFTVIDAFSVVEDSTNDVNLVLIAAIVLFLVLVAGFLLVMHKYKKAFKRLEQKKRVNEIN